MIVALFITTDFPLTWVRPEGSLLLTPLGFEFLYCSYLGFHTLDLQFYFTSQINHFFPPQIPLHVLEDICMGTCYTVH